MSGIIDFLSGREPELPRTGSLVPSGSDSEELLALLNRADGSMNSLRSVHECNNINGVITLLDYSAPEIMRYRVVGGGESVIKGDGQWYRRSDGPSQFQPRGEAFRFPDFRYSYNATGVRNEGNQLLDGRSHHLVSFFSPRDEAEYWFWIDAENYRISRLLMSVPPTHYMVSIFNRFDGAIDIQVPRDSEEPSISVRSAPEKVRCQSDLP